MRYLMSIMSSPESESADYEVGPEVYEEMAKYNEEMVKAGVLLTGEGLAPTAQGAEVVFRDGEVTVTDGPFTEAKEFIAGYWVIQVSSHEEAVEWAKRFPAGGEGEAKIQLRRIGELEDMDQMPEELKERERELREQGH
jgi:hypothetical protein